MIYVIQIDALVTLAPVLLSAPDASILLQPRLKDYYLHPLSDVLSNLPSRAHRKMTMASTQHIRERPGTTTRTSSASVVASGTSQASNLELNYFSFTDTLITFSSSYISFLDRFGRTYKIYIYLCIRRQEWDGIGERT